MERIKVVIINNHFQYSYGTVRALIGMVNNMYTESNNDDYKYDVLVTQ